MHKAFVNPFDEKVKQKAKRNLKEMLTKMNYSSQYVTHGARTERIHGSFKRLEEI